MSVSRRVFDGPVVSLSRVRLVLEMNAVAMVLRHQAEVDQVNVVLLRPAVSEQQVLSLDVVVDVPFRVDVLENVKDLEGEVERDFAAKEFLSGLENLLEVVSEPVHDEESVLLVAEIVTSAASVTWHAQ